MFELLWLLPLLPFCGFILLALFGKHFSRAVSAIIGVGSVGISALLTILIGLKFLTDAPTDYAFTQTLWQWISVGSFSPSITLRLDALSMVMIFVVTFVGFMIHLYSAEFMQNDDGFSRFFAYMNLFISAMLILVLADNLLLLYLGWEGVGLCSFLLIGFWYKEEKNAIAARKAFLVTRIGDTAMAIGLFILFQHLGSLQIQTVLQRASEQWPVGSGTATAASLLLLGGALGKSAQLPLQTWLPDAMAGPTPVSALIHAATMVTAGVYLIARTHILFSLAPSVQMLVAIIGAITLLMAGFSALTQWDIKRVLAYSTISQIGYMFLALGVGAWSAAIFHLMIHAFFKALLFLGAGVVIVAMNEEHNMFKMGGLRHKLPVVFWTFLIASGSLAAVPLITGGFYSKDLIIWRAWSAELGNPWLWLAAIVGALLTAMYTFRLVFVTFYGTAQKEVEHHPGVRLKLPLIALAALSILGGFLEVPETLGNLPIFSHFLQDTLPKTQIEHAGLSTELLFQIISAVVALSGIYIAYWLYIKHRTIPEKLANKWARVHQLWFSDWGLDWLYNRLFARPFIYLARINQSDFFDLMYSSIARLNLFAYRLIRRSQTGQLRWYVMVLVFGAVLTIAWVVL